MFEDLLAVPDEALSGHKLIIIKTFKISIKYLRKQIFAVYLSQISDNGQGEIPVLGVLMFQK